MDPIGEQLASWGTVLRLKTRGRVTGRPVEVAVGFVAAADGSLVVAAGDAGADWARNLATDPNARVSLAEATFDATAERLEGAEAAQAVVNLILKYGTSAERLGRGPVFRLRPSAGQEAP
jgi:deazaflavin-dependent oxidoreductase (nitroreductase family)